MLRIVLHTVPRVGRSYEHFPDGFELHLLPNGRYEECKEHQPSSSLLLSSLELSVDTKVYEPSVRARLGTAAHFCEVVVRQPPPARTPRHAESRHGYRGTGVPRPQENDHPP